MIAVMTLYEDEKTYKITVEKKKRLKKIDAYTIYKARFFFFELQCHFPFGESSINPRNDQ